MLTLFLFVVTCVLIAVFWPVMLTAGAIVVMALMAGVALGLFMWALVIVPSVYLPLLGLGALLTLAAYVDSRS